MNKRYLRVILLPAAKPFITLFLTEASSHEGPVL
jgi:hypothetical protein